MKLFRSSQPEPSHPLLGRDVYEIPILSEQGRPLFVLVDQDHRHVGPARELPPGMSRTVFAAQLHAELDRERPIQGPRKVQD